jgi:hypothetical protein
MVTHTEDDPMTAATWTWAQLDAQGLELLEETERALGADYVVVYAPGDPRVDAPARLPLPPAALDAAQLERLRGLEAQVGGVAVAYQRPA